MREAGQARTLGNKEGLEVQRRELNKSHDASSRRVDEQVTAASQDRSTLNSHQIQQVPLQRKLVQT